MRKPKNKSLEKFLCKELRAVSNEPKQLVKNRGNAVEEFVLELPDAYSLLEVERAVTTYYRGKGFVVIRHGYPSANGQALFARKNSKIFEIIVTPGNGSDNPEIVLLKVVVLRRKSM